MVEEKRTDERHDMRVRMDYRNEGGGDFLYEYTTNISEGGLFVSTRDPLDVGTMIQLRFQPPGMDETIEVKGKVVWVNQYREDSDDNPNPGMGIQFQELSEEERDTIAQIVRAIAYL